jgi:hypothetical protein
MGIKGRIKEGFNEQAYMEMRENRDEGIRVNEYMPHQSSCHPKTAHVNQYAK